MLAVTGNGLWCAAGGFYIDPSRRVDRALITHAHSDHARPGTQAYACAVDGVEVLRGRLGRNASVTGVPYGESVRMGDVTVSFHPAGHVLGSAQIRIKHRGEVWVVSGDYKRQPDPTCAPFEPLRCDVFVTESTFGLPVYRWPDPGLVFDEINAWWRANREAGRTSVLFGYSLGKAQRLLAGVDPGIGPIFVHQTVHDFLPAYAAAGVTLPPVELATPERIAATRGRALVIAPPGADGPEGESWDGDAAIAFASGWMLVRGARRLRMGGRGFVISDHADWPGLITTIRETAASRILVTHGASVPLVRWLNANGLQAETLAARDAARDAGPMAHD